MYIRGEWNVLCPRCGFKYKSHDMRKEWTGEWVCKYDWDPRHPQDFVRGIKDDQSVPFSYPDVAWDFSVVTGDDISFSGNTISSSIRTDLSIFSGTITVLNSIKNDGDLTVTASTANSITVAEALTTELAGAVITITATGNTGIFI